MISYLLLVRVERRLVKFRRLPVKWRAMEEMRKLYHLQISMKLVSSLNSSKLLPKSIHSYRKQKEL